MNRVVITGCGAVSSIGIGMAEFTDGLRAGRSGVRPISLFDTSGFDYANGCEVTGFEPEQWIKQCDIAELGRAARFVVAAARMAMQEAGLRETTRPGLISIGSADGESFDLDALVGADVAGIDIDPVVAKRVSAARLSTAISDELELSTVEPMTLATACSAGNYAIGYALDAVRAGDVDYALCGGADAMCRKIFAGFYRLGTIAPDCCRPFDRDRKGILTGEGAGVLVLESLPSATARCARIYAEVLGYGANCDAFHPVAPDQAGVAQCLRLALDDARLRPDEVDMISAHGTGTESNDITEVAAIREVYGPAPPPTISVKSMLGHTMGAASALASIACAAAVQHGFIPPTINHANTDPRCPVDCVPNKSRPAALRVVQNNGLAFGGTNASVILGRFDG